MAISYPPNPNFINKSEKKVHEKLLSLSDSWHIYANMRQHITIFEKVSRSEIDFILTHPFFGIVLMEVKGFGVFSKNGSWFRTEAVNGEGTKEKRIKSPYMQIEDARGNLKDFLHDQKEALAPYVKSSSDINKITIHTLVVFPYLPDFENLGIESEKNNTVTQKDLEDIDKFLKTNIPKLKFKDFKKIQAKLKEIIIPDVNTVPMRGLTRDIEQQLMSSTEEQSIILNSILDNNSKIFVSGPAGSGKTILAVMLQETFLMMIKKYFFFVITKTLEST